MIARCPWLAPHSLIFQSAISRSLHPARSKAGHIRPLFLHIASLIDQWGTEFCGRVGFSSVGAVVGATSGQAIQQIRQAMPHTIFLIPGLGAQGGSLTDCLPAFDAQGYGAVISASRSIIFAHRDKMYKDLSPDAWSKAVESAVLATKKEIGMVIRTA